MNRLHLTAVTTTPKSSSMNNSSHFSLWLHIQHRSAGASLVLVAQEAPSLHDIINSTDGVRKDGTENQELAVKHFYLESHVTFYRPQDHISASNGQGLELEIQGVAGTCPQGGRATTASTAVTSR